MRVLVYARYWTDLRDALSIDTQLTMCRRELAQREWTKVGCYTDGAVRRDDPPAWAASDAAGIRWRRH